MVTSDIGLNPVLAGSGSNLKLCEYIAYGIPVITTVHGNRGFGFKDKAHLLVAEISEFPHMLRESLQPSAFSLWQKMQDNSPHPGMTGLSLPPAFWLERRNREL